MTKEFFFCIEEKKNLLRKMLLTLCKIEDLFDDISTMKMLQIP